jgi:hypothetical protein
MKTDYFFKDYILTTYKDHKREIFKIEIYDRKQKKTYRTLNKEIIERLEGVN